MTGITQRIQEIRTSLPSHVRLIAVSKKVSVPELREAYEAGVRDFGENRLTEALPKQEQLKDLPDITWHFIGHLQGNKAKKALEHFQWIHSVDSLKLAVRLNRLAEKLCCQPQVCLQVKMLPDPNKYGWSVPDMRSCLPELDQCRGLQIKGLMTILPFGLSTKETLAAFEATRHLAEKIRGQNWSHIQMEQLSMGMSGDYLLAVKAGATAIRLGTKIFGDRTL